MLNSIIANFFAIVLQYNYKVRSILKKKFFFIPLYPTDPRSTTPLDFLLSNKITENSRPNSLPLSLPHETKIKPHSLNPTPSQTTQINNQRPPL